MLQELLYFLTLLGWPSDAVIFTELPGRTGVLLTVGCDVIALAKEKQEVTVDLALCCICHQLEYIFSRHGSEGGFSPRSE